VLLLEKTSRRRNSPKKIAGKTFRVRDFPFFFMHWIITKNNQNIGEAIRELGVTPHVWRILALLQERDGVSITELSDASLIDRTLLSRILSDLERRGFVRKRLNSKDMRYTAVYLTSAGGKKFAELLPIARRQIERAIAGLSASELKELNKTLAVIIRNLSRSPL
jgi:DNA-binding MarR family transcriptional regulator